MIGPQTNLLVFGKSGQLATALADQGAAICLGRNEVDIFSQASLVAAIDTHVPRVVINAAAYTAVDRAENEREIAAALNAVAPAAIAQACAAMRVPLVHLSTDYVFDGAGGAPYAEDAQVSPVNAYGQTKAAGEEAVLSSDGQAAVLRTSWVFSERPGNFVSTMLQLAAERQEIDVVFDVSGRPTSSHTLAEACAGLANAMVHNKDVKGIFHFTNSGDASWAMLAEAVMEEAWVRGWKSARIRPIRSVDYPAEAQRPRDTRLRTDKIERLLGWGAPHWRVSLRETLDRLGAI